MRLVDGLAGRAVSGDYFRYGLVAQARPRSTPRWISPRDIAAVKIRGGGGRPAHRFRAGHTIYDGTVLASEWTPARRGAPWLSPVPLTSSPASPESLARRRRNLGDGPVLVGSEPIDEIVQVARHPALVESVSRRRAAMAGIAWMPRSRASPSAASRTRAAGVWARRRACSSGRRRRAAPSNFVPVAADVEHRWRRAAPPTWPPGSRGRRIAAAASVPCRMTQARGSTWCLKARTTRSSPPRSRSSPVTPIIQVQTRTAGGRRRGSTLCVGLRVADAEGQRHQHARARCPREQKHRPVVRPSAVKECKGDPAHP